MMGEPPIAVSVAPADLAQAAAVSNVARALDAPEIIEYWKSAPYLLNFMRHYSLKRLLKRSRRTFRYAPRRAPGRPAGNARSTTRSTPMRRSSPPTAACARSWTTYSAPASNSTSGFPPPCPTTGRSGQSRL